MKKDINFYICLLINYKCNMLYVSFRLFQILLE